MFKNTYLGNSDNGLFVVFSRMNGNTEELDVSIADLICYAGKRPIILYKDNSAYSLTKVETSYDAQADETTVVAVFGNNGYKVVVSGAVNSASKGTFVYDAASGGSGSTGGGLTVHADSESDVLDKTWQEIKDAAPSVTLINEMSGNLVRNVFMYPLCFISEKGEMAPPEVENQYKVSFSDLEGGEYMYACSNPDEYPVYHEEDSGDA